jgi:16S rRNA (guanine966-N2)-methyltransferase
MATLSDHCSNLNAHALKMARKRPANTPAPRPRENDTFDRDPEVRIIGGQFRGRRLNYHGDSVVRPMKHRTREAIFNLISTECGGLHAIDLFAGTGALGLEALSRGAAHATFIEKHVPTARVVDENIRILGVEDRTTVVVTSAFLWAKRDLPELSTLGQSTPWLIFCSPPYAFYTERQAEMLDLIARMREHAPAGSILVVEAEEPFDFDVIRGANTPADEANAWDVRTYVPAVVGIWRKP